MFLDAQLSLVFNPITLLPGNTGKRDHAFTETDTNLRLVPFDRLPAAVVAIFSLDICMTWKVSKCHEHKER